jgi:Zn-dependent protease
MSEGKPEHPAVKIASVVGGIVFVIVLMLAVLAKEQLSVVGWIVIPLAIMAIALAGFASMKKE